MDKVIVTVMLIIASVAATAMAINAAFPAIVRSNNSIVRASQQVNERLETQIKIIMGTGELDSNGTWQDTDADAKFDVTLWVKNVGASKILEIPEMDVFVGSSNSYARIPYTSYAAGLYPQWSYSLASGTEFTESNTLKISVHYSTAQSSTTYLAKVITASGAYDEEYFSY